MRSSPESGDSGSPCEFNQNLRILREIALFAGMPMQVHKLLAYLCSRETFEPGELLFRQGDDDGQAIYIISGAVALIRSDDRGRKVFIAEYTGGDFLGGLSLLAPSPRLFSLEAKTRTVCMMLSRDKFQHAMEQFPQVMPKVIQAIVQRIGDWDKHLLNNPAMGIENIMAQAGVSII